MDHYTAKAITTLAAAVPCTAMVMMTKGEHGIGWFIVALLFIW